MISLSVTHSPMPLFIIAVQSGRAMCETVYHHLTEACNAIQVGALTLSPIDVA